jgi:hypothetical protein
MKSIFIIIIFFFYINIHLQLYNSHGHLAVRGVVHKFKKIKTPIKNSLSFFLF